MCKFDICRCLIKVFYEYIVDFKYLCIVGFFDGVLYFIFLGVCNGFFFMYIIGFFLGSLFYVVCKFVEIVYIVILNVL